MAQKKKPENTEFETLKQAVKEGSLGKLYIFHGEERYLLENFVAQIRSRLVPDDFAEFNHRRFDGSFPIDELFAATDTLPVFTERTLIEVHDYDIFKANDETKQRLIELFSDLPEYLCLIFIYDTVEYKPDNRQKLASALKTFGSVVEFSIQEQPKLIKWIKTHFKETGKDIDTPAAEYLAFITGGLMTSMNSEIEKVSAYAPGNLITREMIDAVVTPVLDAVTYKLTDCIAQKQFDEAASLLDELFSMREPPHKMIYSISLKMRQLLMARLCLNSGQGEKRLMDICGIRYDFQARSLMSSARQMTLEECRNAVLSCTETAYFMNTSGDPEALLIELLLRLAASKRKVCI
jgi:DNA polymerase-3 subunit delta